MSSLLEVVPKNVPKIRHVLPQVLVTVIVSWLSIIGGYATAYSSPAESSMIQELNITRREASWIGSLLSVGALAGSLLGGLLVELQGRKATLITTNLVFLTAWAINYFSWNSWSMYGSRILSGYCVGVTSFALPVYLAETLQPKIRGRLGLFPTAFGNLGILICFICGNVFEWRRLAGIGALLSIPFLIAAWIIPETPRWCVSKKQLRRAGKALRWLRGKHFDINEELSRLKCELAKGAGKNETLRKHMKVFGIVTGLMFFQQFSGINAIIFYDEQIFEEAKSSVSAAHSTVIVGGINFVSIFIAASVVDKLGRKVLMYISSSIVALMLATLGTYFFFLEELEWNLESVSWVPLTCFVLYVLGFSLGLGPIPWLMMAELFPARIRGPAASVAAAFNWTCTFVITKTFPLFSESAGSCYAFWFFCVSTLCSLVFLKYFVPETKKRTLEEIERVLYGN